jgi:hypothetical protein
MLNLRQASKINQCRVLRLSALQIQIKCHKKCKMLLLLLPHLLPLHLLLIPALALHHMDPCRIKMLRKVQL